MSSVGATIRPRSADDTRASGSPANLAAAGSKWQRQRQVQQPRRRLAGRAVHRDLLMVWEDNIDLGEGIIPIHLLNPICAVHLRQEHGFKRWQTGRFRETYPWLIREDDTFAFAALHYLVHVEQGVVPLGESGTVAFMRLIKPPGTDHLHP